MWGRVTPAPSFWCNSRFFSVSRDDEPKGAVHVLGYSGVEAAPTSLPGSQFLGHRSTHLGSKAFRHRDAVLARQRVLAATSTERRLRALNEFLEVRQDTRSPRWDPPVPGDLP